MIDAKDGYVSRAAASKHQMLAATLELAKDRVVELADGIEPMVCVDLSEVTAQAYASPAATI
jgi:hypothetical protein